MKKNIFTLIIIFCSFLFANSQISIQDWNGKDLQNNETYNLPEGSWEEAYHFSIKNNGSSEINFIIEVTEFTRPDDDELVLSVCGAGQCIDIQYDSETPIQIGNATTLLAGDTYGEEGNSDGEEADVRYIPEGNYEHVYLTIRVYEEGNESNAVSFTLDNQVASIKDNIVNNVSVYPNPATKNLNIKVSDELLNSYIILTNLLGKLELKKKITSKYETINIENFNKGIYFYSIVTNGKIIETKKLIIK